MRDMRRLDPHVRERLLDAIGELASDPRKGDIAKLKQRTEWRLRVGTWRILFQRNPKRRLIQVVRVLPRGRAYRS
jgi:mRNA interferase RelE/StbE